MKKILKRLVPFDGSYTQANNHFKISKSLAYISVIFAVVLSILEQYSNNIDEIFVQNYYFIDTQKVLYFIGYLNGILVLVYLYFEYRGSYIFNLAEMRRRLDFVDNTFGTNFSDTNSSGYYTNDNIDIGIYKMAVNNFENCLTTNYNLKYMFPRLLRKNSIMCLLFIFAAAFGEKHIVRIIAESLILATLVLELIKLWVYSNQIEKLLGKWRTLFHSLNPKNISQTETAQLMMSVLEYETTLAWASIPLDSNFFFKNKPFLDNEWNKQKKKLGIP